jgi:hypothetical protein
MVAAPVESDRPPHEVPGEVTIQGRSGKNAPREKKRNDEIAAVQGEPVAEGSIPSSSRAWVRTPGRGFS